MTNIARLAMQQTNNVFEKRIKLVKLSCFRTEHLNQELDYPLDCISFEIVQPTVDIISTSMGPHTPNGVLRSCITLLASRLHRRPLDTGV